MKSDSTYPVSIKEITARVGTSIRTVDRASLNCPARILRDAGSLGYKPNPTARTLPIRIASFFDPLRDGLKNATAAMHGLTDTAIWSH